AFTQIGGVARKHIARILADGTADPLFNPSLESTNASFLLRADGEIVLSKIVQDVEEQTVRQLSNLRAHEFAFETVIFDSSSVLWLRNGTLPELASCWF